MADLDPVTPSSPAKPLPQRRTPVEPRERERLPVRKKPDSDPDPDMLTDDDGAYRDDDAPGVDDYA
jgi:hypothetical protein